MDKKCIPMTNLTNDELIRKRTAYFLAMRLHKDSMKGTKNIP